MSRERPIRGVPGATRGRTHSPGHHREDLPAYDRDDGLLAAAREADRPLLRVEPWRGLAAVVGRGGDPGRELRPERLRADGVPVLRRSGGGCAVLLDPGNVVVSVAWPLPGIGDITGAFAAVSAWLAAGLARAGLPGVRQRGISDLALGERKVGGACIRRTRGLLHYGTTLLVDPDLRLIERYLPHPPREPDYRRGRSHAEFMGRLADLEPGLDAAGLAGRLARILDPAELRLGRPGAAAAPAPAPDLT